ncbi:hypothetical protein V8D89_004494 [Ganoderma adspersum]
MSRTSVLSFLVTLNCFLHVSSRPISLYIPGGIWDSQPVTPAPIGTDSIGYTTWRVQVGQGVHSGTFAGPRTGVDTLASATLALGSRDAHLLMVGSATAVREDCVFATGANGGPSLAFCSKFYANPTLTTAAAVVETVIPMDVQASAETSDRVGSGWPFSGLPTWMQAVLRPQTGHTY